MHRSFEVPTFVFKPRFPYESFSILNLVSNGSSFSLIAIMVYEIWPIYWNRVVCDVIILSIFLSMIETSNEKKFNYRIVPNCPDYLQFKFNDFWMSSLRDMLAQNSVNSKIRYWNFICKTALMTYFVAWLWAWISNN